MALVLLLPNNRRHWWPTLHRSFARRPRDKEQRLLFNNWVGWLGPLACPGLYKWGLTVVCCVTSSCCCFDAYMSVWGLISLWNQLLLCIFTWFPGLDSGYRPGPGLGLGISAWARRQWLLYVYSSITAHWARTRLMLIYGGWICKWTSHKSKYERASPLEQLISIVVVQCIEIQG